MRRTVATCVVVLAVFAAIVVALAPPDAGRAPGGNPGGGRVGSARPTAARPARTTATRTTAAMAATTTTTATTATTATAVTLTTAARGPLGSGQAVTLAFGGDVHFEGALRARLLADPVAVLAPVAGALSAADLAMVNLETAITERGEPQPKRFTFRAPASALDALRAAGVDVATMANNHGIDFGPTGLEDSLAAVRDTRFPVVGIGADETAAYAPYRVTVKGQRLAILGATQVLDDALAGSWTAGPGQAGVASADRLERLLGAVRGARATADTVVVYLHWGTERQTCPQQRQRALARALVEAGADIVVGTHAHRLQGAGRLARTAEPGEALVAYGLGNFVFSTRAGPGTTSGLLRVTVTGRRLDGYGWAPATIRGGVAEPLAGEAAAAAVADWQARRSCTDLAP